MGVEHSDGQEMRRMIAKLVECKGTVVLEVPLIEIINSYPGKNIFSNKKYKSIQIIRDSTRLFLWIYKKIFLSFD